MTIDDLKEELANKLFIAKENITILMKIKPTDVIDSNKDTEKRDIQNDKKDTEVKVKDRMYNGIVKYHIRYQSFVPPSDVAVISKEPFASG